MLVCKDWYALIKSQSFIKEQLHYLSSHPKRTNLFLLTDLVGSNNVRYRLFRDDPDEVSPQMVQNYPFPFHTDCSGISFRLVGTVNGVIMLSDDIFGYKENYILWNPLIKKYVQLPKPRAVFEFIGAVMDVLGFGYDSVKDDYKVVRVAYAQGNDGLAEIPTLAEVYSVREGNWRWIEADGVGFCIAEKYWSCFLKGSVHWLAFERREVDRGFKGNWVLLFDVAKEKFKKMRLPTELAEANTHTLRIFDNHGLLCVAKSTMAYGEIIDCDIWVKKEYTVGNSWCKMVSVDLTGGFIRPMCIMNNGNMIMVRGEHVFEVVSYDPQTGKGKRIDVVRFMDNCGACSFKESLVFLEKETNADSY